MKICFITTNILSLGGVQRGVSVLANEFSKNNEITILCTSRQGSIKDNIYKLEDTIKIDYMLELLETNIFNKLFKKFIKEINRSSGILNNEKNSDRLLKTYFPISIQRKVLNYINKNNFNVIIGD